MNAPMHSTQRSIGAILMDAGLLKAEDAERVLKLQKVENLRFGDAAIQLGILTENDIRYALSYQFDYVYLPSTEDKPVSEELVAAYQPFSHEVEQLRVVRSQLILRWFDKERGKSLLAIAGTAPGDGCSYIAANLAIVFSQLGERTLLIDSDLRAPRQHSLFKLENKIGFSSILAGRASSDDAIVRIPVFANLSVLPAGPVPPNPQELLNRPAFNELLDHAKEAYDVVLIDTSSMSAGPDAVVVASYAGAALAVARMIETRAGAFRDMVQALARSGIAVVGSVLNDPPLVIIPKAASVNASAVHKGPR
jgi:protein-tyrosine kinase